MISTSCVPPSDVSLFGFRNVFIESWYHQHRFGIALLRHSQTFIIQTLQTRLFTSLLLTLRTFLREFGSHSIEKNRPRQRLCRFLRSCIRKCSYLIQKRWSSNFAHQIVVSPCPNLSSPSSRVWFAFYHQKQEASAQVVPLSRVSHTKVLLSFQDSFPPLLSASPSKANPIACVKLFLH